MLSSIEMLNYLLCFFSWCFLCWIDLLRQVPVLQTQLVCPMDLNFTSMSLCYKTRKTVWRNCALKIIQTGCFFYYWSLNSQWPGSYFTASFCIMKLEEKKEWAELSQRNLVFKICFLADTAFLLIFIPWLKSQCLYIPEFQHRRKAGKLIIKSSLSKRLEIENEPSSLIVTYFLSHVASK